MPFAVAPDWDELFVSAALEPDRWPQALLAMANATGASHGQLVAFGPGREMPFNLVTGFDAAAIQRSLENGGASPELNYRILASNVSISAGKFDPVLHERHYDAAIPQLASRSYIEFCDELDIRNGCQTNLVVDDGGMIGLATLRTRREGRSRLHERRVFARAAEAARRAVRFQERLENDQARLLAGTFDAMEATAFILDAAGSVQALTAGAEALVKSGTISLSRNRLDAPGAPFDLASAVAELARPDGLSHLQLRIETPGAGPACFFEGFRLPARLISFGRLPHAVLIQRQPQRDRAGIAAYLGVLYDLSAAEADIAMRLHRGQTRAEIASVRSVTPDTLRGQVKSLLAKMGCTNESALMRLLGAIMN